MKIHQDVWSRFANSIKARLLSMYDPAVLVPPVEDLIPKLRVQHCGFYITMYDTKQEKAAREGFLKKEAEDIIQSANSVAQALYTKLQAEGVSSKSLSISSFNFVVVWDLIFVKNALSWNENSEGVYFCWGDRYKGLYLPHEITRMSATKVEILNRLCSWECHVPSNLWRLPCGQIWKIVCDSYTI